MSELKQLSANGTLPTPSPPLVIGRIQHTGVKTAERYGQESLPRPMYFSLKSGDSFIAAVLNMGRELFSSGLISTELIKIY